MQQRPVRLIPLLRSLPGLCLLFLVLIMCRSAFSAPVSAEYKLKAALLYKLTRFVQWPAEAAQRPDNTFGVCVLGRDDFGPALDALRGRTVKGVPITIHRFDQSMEIDRDCQMIFISDSKKPFIEPIIRSLEDRAVLTIGDTSRFAERGGMIQFVRHGRRVGFRINLGHVQAAGLKVAAPLLELATIVGGKHNRAGR